MIMILCCLKNSCSESVIWARHLKRSRCKVQRIILSLLWGGGFFLKASFASTVEWYKIHRRFAIKQIGQWYMESFKQISNIQYLSIIYPICIRIYMLDSQNHSLWPTNVFVIIFLNICFHHLPDVEKPGGPQANPPRRCWVPTHQSLRVGWCSWHLPTKLEKHPKCSTDG